MGRGVGGSSQMSCRGGADGLFFVRFCARASQKRQLQVPTRWTDHPSPLDHLYLAGKICVV